jgi:hypothetical protein
MYSVRGQEKESGKVREEEAARTCASAERFPNQRELAF